MIAASAGNHALALAWHGTQLGIPVTVVMPTIAPLTKVCIRRTGWWWWVESCRELAAVFFVQTIVEPGTPS